MILRSIGEIKLVVQEIDSGNGLVLPSIRVTIRKGETEQHFVSMLTGEWHCDCQGFISHGRCRHTNMVMEMQNDFEANAEKYNAILNQKKGSVLQ